MGATVGFLQNQLYCVAEQVVETIALVERRIAERRDKLQRPVTEFDRGYHTGYADAMKFAHSELERINRLDGVSEHVAEATANLT